MVEVDDWDGKGTLPMLYAKTATGAVNTWLCWVVDDSVWVRWGQVDGAQQEASFKCLPKNEGRSNATTANDQAIKEAVAKWKKQVKKKYHLSSEASTSSLNLKPMLAKAYEEHRHNLVWPVLAQPKYDGLRCLTYEKDMQAFLQSRGGDPYDVKHIMDDLTPIFREGTGFPQRYILDGELYAHGVSLQTLNSWVRRPQPDSGLLFYRVYDIAFPDSPSMSYGERRYLLDRFLSRLARSMPFVKPVPDLFCADHEDVMRYHERIVSEGYEGVIVRSMQAPYRFAYRSSGLLKVKAFQDGEFVIIGHTVGKGKFANVPIFRCQTSAGAVFDCAPKGTDAERLQMLRDAPSLVGQLLKVQFFDYTADGVPHYPVGLGIRHRSDL